MSRLINTSFNCELNYNYDLIKFLNPLKSNRFRDESNYFLLVSKWMPAMRQFWDFLEVTFVQVLHLFKTAIHFFRPPLLKSRVPWAPEPLTPANWWNLRLQDNWDLYFWDLDNWDSDSFKIQTFKIWTFENWDMNIWDSEFKIPEFKIPESKNPNLKSPNLKSLDLKSPNLKSLNLNWQISIVSEPNLRTVRFWTVILKTFANLAMMYWILFSVLF